MSTLKLDTLSNKAGTASVPSDTIVSGTAKAWVNFNGNGTVAIRRAFNVSSITDIGTGLYFVNFTNAMPDANYAAGVFGGDVDNQGAYDNTLITTSYQTSTSVRLVTRNVQAAGSATSDVRMASVAIFS